ncbi:hypothetical protein TNCV_4544191 [Trichonephila clavipes]|nr:hypothetical protein TNCV_4544191 [Trichonephila clavipes]
MISSSGAPKGSPCRLADALQICRDSKSSHWCGMVVWRREGQLRSRPRHLIMFRIMRSVANSSQVDL